ncbi:MAG: FHA domain-containing protein [Planctomycetes bacterium]|nr:FHA domain-containing protein [Planctomycetota bacterium]
MHRAGVRDTLRPARDSVAIELTVTHLTGSKQSKVECVRGAPIWFGRAEKCQIRFDPTEDLKVSAIHAELREGEEGVTLHDLDSRNGVLLDGERIDGVASVANRSTIQLGHEGPRLRLEFEEALGGISFGRVRKDTRRKLDKNKILAPLLSTDESMPAYTPEQLGVAEEPEKPEPPLVPIAIALGVVLLLVILSFAFS